MVASDELLPYTLTALHKQQYQFLQCVKKDHKQNNILNDSKIFCSVPLDILAPKLKLTLVTAEKLAVLHDMHMPYKVVSNAEHQKTWYQENAEK
jgi:hypothetical protein